MLIRGAAVVDGSGADPVRADVRVEGATIAEVAQALTPAEGEEGISRVWVGGCAVVEGAALLADVPRAG